MKKVFLKSLCASLILVLFSCATTKMEEKFSFEDGIYSYSFERITENTQTKSLYLESKTKFSQLQTKISSGNAINMEGMKIDLIDFSPKQSILIEKDGKVWSKTNSTIKGFATEDGRIAWTGTFIEHNQTVQISEYGVLNRENEYTLASSNLNGKYSVNLGPMYGKFDFSLQDGIAESEIGSFIVNKDGEFRSYFSIKIIQQLNDNIQINTLAENTNFGKIDSNGNLTFQMISAPNDKVLTFLGKKISEKTESFSKKIVEAEEKIETAPKWFKTQNTIKKDKIFICKKQNANDEKTAKRIALQTSLSELASYKALITKLEDKNSKSLYELIRIKDLNKEEYKITNEFFDEKTNTFYIRIESNL